MTLVFRLRNDIRNDCTGTYLELHDRYKKRHFYFCKSDKLKTFHERMLTVAWQDPARGGS